VNRARIIFSEMLHNAIRNGEIQSELLAHAGVNWTPSEIIKKHLRMRNLGK
jgi:hypothetical protein